ncbi:MAG: molybdopterin converting factor subunit 1 [Aestuariibacter sp.]
MIKVKFFAKLREQFGCDQLNLDYSGEHNVDELKQSLLAKGERWHSLASSDVLCAVNQTLSDPSGCIHDGDEIAFFPPVTGG